MHSSLAIRHLISGMGLCTSAGADCKTNWQSVKNSADFFEPQDTFHSPRYAGKLCASAKKYLPKFENKKLSKCAKILFSAINEALEQANLSAELKAQCGVFLGTSIGGVFECEEALKASLNSEGKNLSALRFYECSSLADLAAKYFKLGGMRATFSTACSSSGLAVEAACHAINDGKIKAALVCGVDALSRITVNGFGSLLLLSNGKCKPFDKNRDGINLGEGAAAILIISDEYISEKTKIFAEISSCASSCDAYHATAPQPEGLGLSYALNKLIKNTNLSLKDIDCVCSHGTGTAGNDSSEFAAFKNFFGENIPPYFSLKGIFGHTLGASGLVNLIMSVCAMQEGLIPSSAGFKDLDPEIPQAPLLENTKATPKHIISNSLGFGGNNSSVLISKFDEKNISKKEKKNIGELYLYSAGLISPLGNSQEEFSKNVKEKNFAGKCDTSNILKNIPPLKKRKFARLQQMALDAAGQALENISQIPHEPKTNAVVFATGLGMTAETGKFIENVLQKNEAEPMPSAFTNSVHNAVSSAIANTYGFMGLNSALTAKELSFEAAVWQAWAQIKYANSDFALLAAADEHTPYADIFKAKHAVYAKSNIEISEGALAYFAGKQTKEASFAFAKILALEFSQKTNSKYLANLMESALYEKNLSAKDIRGTFVPSISNKFEAKIFAEITNLLSLPEALDISQFAGLSYINSAYFPLFAKELGKGVYLNQTISSTGQFAFTILEIL